MARALALLVAPLLVAGCMDGNRLAFAPPAETDSRVGVHRGRALTAVFGDGNLILAAPGGFCFDAQMEEHSGSGGFALMARCESLNRFSRFRSSDSALLTATVGAVSAGTPTPSTEALQAAFTSSRAAARVLETRGDQGIPLIKLHLEGHSAEGASGTHWRGAFVVQGHLVSVALYAPDGSGYLGDAGARLIREFVRASRSATHLAEATARSRPELPQDLAPAQAPHPLSRASLAKAAVGTSARG